MKKFWITFGAIAFALILGTGIILLCCLPKAAPYNDKNDPAIEIPVDPETPPENPDNKDKDKEEEKDPNEQPDDPKPEQPEDPKPEQPEDHNEEEIVGTVIPFSFNDGAIVGYSGNDKEITIPTSYSFGGYKTEETTFENIWDFYDWYHRNQFEWKGKEITIKLANGEDYVIYNSSNILPELENIEDAFPIIYIDKKEVFVEGNDFQVDTIGASAFSGKQFSKVEIPYGITKIENYAFSGCSSMTELSLPNSLIEIEQAGFYKCTALESLTIPDSVTTLGYLAFSECTSITSVVLPKNAVNLGMCIFENCYGLVYARVESEITRLSNENFAHCTSLKTVELPDNLVEIGGCQFFGCTSLEYIKIPDTVKVIGERSFNNCTSLVELDLPASLTELKISSDYYKIGLVYNCPALERIIIRSEIQIDLTELNKSYQYGTRCDIYIADELLTSYQQTYPNMRFLGLSNLM